jgi:hypothetical protein
MQQAKMILYVAKGLSNNGIAACLDTRSEVASLWRKRFFGERLAGLEDHSCPRRPTNFSPRT